MSLRDQTDKELADAGRMLMNEVNKIAVELMGRGVTVKLRRYYGDGIRYEFEAKRTTTEVI